MARIIMIISGLLALAGGIKLALLWWPALLVILQGAAIILLLLFGLVLVILGISEVAGSIKRRE